VVSCAKVRFAMVEVEVEKDSEALPAITHELPSGGHPWDI